MATDPTVARALRIADKLREGYLRSNARLSVGVTADDLRDASEAIGDLCALLDTVDAATLAAARTRLAADLDAGALRPLNLAPTTKAT